MKYKLVLLFLIVFETGFSQDFNGVYKSVKNDLIEIFNDSTVKFEITYGGGLLSLYTGFGKYYKNGDFLIVKTENSDLVPNSSYKTLGNGYNPNSTLVKVIDTEGVVIKGAYIALYDRKRRFIEGAVMEDEFVILNNLNLAVSLEISMIGFSDLKIPVEAVMGNKIKVEMVTGEVVSDETVKFKIIAENNFLYLAGPIFLPTKYSKKSENIFSKVFYRWSWRYRVDKSHSDITGLILFKKQ
jgi:hypothetical protein